VKNLLLIGFTSFLLAVAVITTSPKGHRHSSTAAPASHVSAPFSVF